MTPKEEGHQPKAERPWVRPLRQEMVDKRTEAIRTRRASKPTYGRPEFHESGYEGEPELVIHYEDPDIPDREIYIPEPRRMPQGIIVEDWSVWRYPRLDPVELAVKAAISPSRMGDKRRILNYLYHHHPQHCAFFIGTTFAEAAMTLLDGPVAKWAEPTRVDGKTVRVERDATPDEINKLRRRWHTAMKTMVDDGLIEVFEGRLENEARSIFVVQIASAAYPITKGIHWLQEHNRLSPNMRWDSDQKPWHASERDGFHVHFDLVPEQFRESVEVTPDTIQAGVGIGLDHHVLDSDQLAHDLTLISKLEQYHPADGWVGKDAYDELINVGGRPCHDARELRACIETLKDPDQHFLLVHLVGLPASKDELGMTSADVRHMDYMKGKGPTAVVDKIIEICDIQNSEYENGESQQVQIALTQLRRIVNTIIGYQLAIAAGSDPDGSQRI